VQSTTPEPAPEREMTIEESARRRLTIVPAGPLHRDNQFVPGEGLPASEAKNGVDRVYTNKNGASVRETDDYSKEALPGEILRFPRAVCKGRNAR
jgi:hypothetical protein